MHVLGNMRVTAPPPTSSVQFASTRHQSAGVAVSRNEMFHHRLSVICVSDAITQYFHVLDATSSAFLSLAISESVFWRMSRAEAARDPRRRLFAPLLLKLLLLQKCNKFPCNGVRVSVRAGRLIFSSLLFLLRYLKKMEKLNVSHVNPHPMMSSTCVWPRQTTTDSILSFWCIPPIFTFVSYMF